MLLKYYAKVHSFLLHLGTLLTIFHSMQLRFSVAISTSATASFLSSFTIMIIMLKLTNMDLH